MKALIVNGSPRMEGNSIILSKETASVLEEAGVEVKTLNLQKMNIKPCMACEKCKSYKDVHCVIGDDMTAVFPDILEADLIVMAGPVYWFSVSAQTKLFMDRWYAFDKNGDSLLKDKKMGVILTYADENPFVSGAVNAYHTFRDAFDYIGAEFCNIVYGRCDGPGEIRKNLSVMEQAKELGRKLIS